MSCILLTCELASLRSILEFCAYEGTVVHRGGEVGSRLRLSTEHAALTQWVIYFIVLMDIIAARDS